MAKIELDFTLQNMVSADPVSTKVRILPGAYPVVVVELKPEFSSATTNQLVYEVAKTYSLDLARLVVIGHYTPEPLKVGYEAIEWMYFDFRREKDLKPSVSGSSIRKLDTNLAFALLERAGWAEEMTEQSKAEAVLLQTLADGSREISLLYKDGKIELKATLAASVGAEQARQIARTISQEAGVSEIKEETAK